MSLGEIRAVDEDHQSFTYCAIVHEEARLEEVRDVDEIREEVKTLLARFLRDVPSVAKSSLNETIDNRSSKQRVPCP